MMTAAFRAELTKVLTQRSFWICLVVLLGLQILLNVQNLGSTTDAVKNITDDGVIEIFVDDPEPAKDGLIGLMVGSSIQVGLFIPILAAIMMGQEFRSGQLGMTFLAMPNRVRALLAKIAAGATVLFSVALLVSVISGMFTYLAARSWDAGLAFSGDAIESHARFVLFAVLYGVSGLSVTLLARSVLTGVMVALASMMITTSQLIALVSKNLDALMPLSAMRNMVLVRSQFDDLSASRVHGFAVLGIWAVVLTSIAIVRVSQRDAR